MLIYLRVLKESFYFAVNALINNKLRTFLSLLGVTIGIFSIIGVLAAVDSLKQEIEGSLSNLSDTTIYFFPEPFQQTDIPRWKYKQFPRVTYGEYNYIKRNIPNVDAVSYQIFLPTQNIKYEKETVSSVGINPVTEDYTEIKNLEFTSGRFFGLREANVGSAVVILGHEVAEGLFGSIDPIGKKVKMLGKKLTVIGVLKKEGLSLVNFGYPNDSSVFLPANFIRRIYGDNNEQIFPIISIKPSEGLDIKAFIANLEQKLRNFRGIKEGQISNFFLNELSGVSNQIDNITGQMSVIGLIISGFSLLVGGFGIANIMFVSVKERTNLIGIQKSLGAKNKFILFQFLFEAVILSLIGGLIGLILVWLVSLLASQFTGDFEFILSPINILLGTIVSSFIGLISGILPAISASKLDPVEAIRTGM